MTYSIDLRQRVIRSWQNGRGQSWIAREFGIGLSTVKRYIERYKATGEVKPTAQERMKPMIGPADKAALQAQVDAHPDATLEEHIGLWADSQSVRVSPATMCRALQKIDRPRKKDGRR